MNTALCPLCLNKNIYQVPKDEKYLFCDTCKLIHIKPSLRKEPEIEKNRYLKHHNNITQVDYINFLSTIIDASLPYINHEMRGLDFGCGPLPVLAQLLKNKGFQCEYYDPFFYPKNFNNTYDYIFSTECFEHFHYPAKEMKKLSELLNTSGFLCIMTERWLGFEQFNEWYYKRDFTHVSFYHEETFEWICKNYSYRIIFKDEKRRIILQKK